MQKFAVALIALVAIFATVVPTVLATPGLSEMKRETNAQRFARGMAPLAPTRRHSARRHGHSPVPVSKSGRIQVRKHGHGSSEDGHFIKSSPQGPYLHVTYSSSTKTLVFTGIPGPSFYGAHVSSDKLAEGSPAFVTLTTVADGSPSDEDRIWSLEHHGELIPTWTNTDGSTIQPDIVLNEDTGVIALTGDHKALGQQDHSWKLVNLYLV